MPRRRSPHRPLAVDSSHWRADGRPKVRYPSRSDAILAADQRGRESGVDLGVYACDYCAGWHMARRRGRSGD